MNWQVLSRRGAAPGRGPALLSRVRAAAGATRTTSSVCWPTTSATSPTALTTTRSVQETDASRPGPVPGLSSPLHPWSPPRSRGDSAHRAWCAEIDGGTAAAMTSGLPRHWRRSRRIARAARCHCLKLYGHKRARGCPGAGGGCTASRPRRAAVGRIVYGRDARQRQKERCRAQRRECQAFSTGDRARTRRPSTPPAWSPRGGTEPSHAKKSKDDPTTALSKDGHDTFTSSGTSRGGAWCGSHWSHKVARCTLTRRGTTTRGGAA